MPEFGKVNPFAEKTSHPILKAIFRYSKLPSFIDISNVINGLTHGFLTLSGGYRNVTLGEYGLMIQFSCFRVDDVFKEIKKSQHA